MKETMVGDLVYRLKMLWLDFRELTWCTVDGETFRKRFDDAVRRLIEVKIEVVEAGADENVVNDRLTALMTSQCFDADPVLRLIA